MGPRSNAASPAEAAAAGFLEAIPNVMAHLRRHLAGSGVGLSIAQFRCLKMVQRNDDVSLGDLAEANGVSAPAMSKLVEGLVAAGHLERRADSDDRRRLLLGVTAQGRRAIEDVSALLRQELADAFGSLSDAQARSLEAGLRIVNDALQPRTDSPRVAA